MSQEEVYKNLEIQIVNNLESLKRCDPFFYHCMGEINEIIKNAPIPPKNNLQQKFNTDSSTEDNIKLAAEFLSLCRQDYGQRFLEDYKNNKIKILPNENSRCQENIKSQEYQVIINENGTLKEALDMVHEYFHVLNLELSKIPYIRQSFTETISLAAELLFLDFLKEKGVAEDECQILKNYRINLYKNNVLSLQYLLPLYMEIKEKSNLSADFYESQAEYYRNKNMDKQTFLMCGYEISEAETSRSDIACYKYVIGYAYASYFHQRNASPSRLSLANESLKTGDISTTLSTLVPTDIEFDELGETIKNEITLPTYQKVKQTSKN